MGWAKFVEDNMEMLDDRFYRPINEERYQQEAIIQVCTILPVATFPIEVNVTVSCTKPSARPDRTLYCRDCGRAFRFSGKEQDFFETKGYRPPKRCKSCRELNKIRCIAYGKRRP